MSRQADFLAEILPDLLFGFPGQRPGGLVLSVVLAVVGVGGGLAVGVAVGSALDARARALRLAAEAYVTVFRGIPLVLLLLFVHAVIGSGRLPGLHTTALGSAFVALILYSSSYQADIIRTGLRSVPAGIVDWARLMGSTRWQVYRAVKLPYSLRVMQPALTGQGITLFKDSSVVVIIGVAELTTSARIALGGDVGNAPFWVATYLTVGLLYFAVAFGLSRLGLAGERRWRVRGRIDMVAVAE